MCNTNLYFLFLSAPNSPKTNSGANGKFLLKPLLFHLRHPNSKTNQPKFWQILSSPKNSFAKTSSALKPHALPEYLEGRTPKRKNVLSILEKIHSRENQKSKEHFFFLGLPSEARRWRGDSSSVQFWSTPPRARSARYISDFGNRCELGTIETPSEVR